MKLHRRLVGYLVAAHVVFAAAGAAAIAAWPQGRWLVLLVEVALVASFVIGLGMIRRLLGRLALIADGAQLLREGDFSTRLVSTGQPEVDALVAVYNGMTDRLREQRVRMEEKEQWIAEVLAASPSGAVILDAAGRVVFVNPAARRWLGTAADARPLAALETPVARALAGLGDGEVTVVALAGGRRLRCRRGSFMDRGAARAFFLLEELTEELRQAEKAAYEKLIRMMAHEVNNSVGASSSLLESCRAYAPLVPAEHREDFSTALEVVGKRTRQLGALMRGFAEVVRLPAPQVAPCDLVALLREVALFMRPACEAQRVHFAWDVAAPLPPITLDRLQMEQVLVNLTKNALEAIDSDGTITFRTGRRREDARPYLVIEDTGPGLLPEARQQLFTPFFTTKPHGQGIGLTLVQQILAQHRFEFTLEGPPGGPTQFTIWF